MNIGYACLAVGIPFTNLRSCILKNFNQNSFCKLVEANLCALDKIIDYNIKNDIKLFRICSELIPFGSHMVNTFEWWEAFGKEFFAIANKIRENNIRISMHPGQYTILNSPIVDVVKRAIEDLEYHHKVLTLLGGDKSNKIVLHIGGVYGDKPSAKKRFIETFNNLDEKYKDHIIIENDDRYYNIKDVYEIGCELGIPVVFDNLHHELNPCDENMDAAYWINKCRNTFKESDGKQKIHYSQQNEGRRYGSHSQTIKAREFLEFVNKIENKDIDIMLEVKDKNLSVIKIKNCLDENRSISLLEKEWARYKYKILECSASDYLSIRTLLKDKNAFPAFEFYEIIDHSLKKEMPIGNAINAAMHVWGYFKDKASENQKKVFLNKIKQFENGKISIKPIKNLLWTFALEYKENYLLDSYYFWL